MSSPPVKVAEGHRVSLRLLDETFAGPVGAATMAELLDSQYSRRLVLLKVLRDLASDEDEAWRALVAVDRHAPGAVRRVLAYPAVGAWLVRAIRKARGAIADDVPVTAELGHLGSVAAAAAVRAGVPVSVEVPLWHGRLHLPTIGQFDLGGAGRVRLRHTDSGTHVDVNGSLTTKLADLPATPLRHHDSEAGGARVRWTIDDIDPYRAFTTVERPARLDNVDYELWCALLDAAWTILVQRHPAYAAELARVGPVIVPVSHSRGLVASSSSASFGAIVVATPDSAEALAETVVHELQHSKLNAVLDLVRLEDGGRRLCYAPWRRDPRPLPGLLHGIYAFMSVAEFWYRQRYADAGGRHADLKFLYHREQVRAAAETVATMPELTEFGTRLIAGIRARLDACDAEDVPAELAGIVSLMLAVHRLSWRLRHLVPRAQHVVDAVRRWLAGDEPPRWHDSLLVPDNRPERDSSLPMLLRARALDGDTPAAADGGEHALSAGRREEAARSFATRIAADPDDDAAWVGLLAARYGAAEPAPAETVSATYRRLGALGDAPDPVTLTDWFAKAAGPG